MAQVLVSFSYLSLADPSLLTARIGIGLGISSIAGTQQHALLCIITIFCYRPPVLLIGFAAPSENMPRGLQPITYSNPLRYMIVVTKGVFLKDMPPLRF